MKDKSNKEINKKELNEVITLSKKILKILYIVFIASLILVSIIAIQKLNIWNILIDFLKVISPLFIGFVIAWLLRPLVLKLNKKIKNNAISAILIFSLFVIIIFLTFYIFVPTFYNEVNELVGLLPGLVERITKGINELFKSFVEHGINLTNFKNKLLLNITNFSIEFAKDLPNTIVNLISTLISGIGISLMGLIIGIYMLIDYDNISLHFRKLFPLHWQKDVHFLAEKMSNEVRKCVNGTFLVALMVLICDSIGFALIGLNAPLLFGVICGITDLIPYIGPYIGGAAAVIVGFTQSPLIGIGTFIICVIVQAVESNILQPIVLSKASNIHPIIIIIALLIFGRFFGVLGMVLATPILVILKVIIEFIYSKIKKTK